MNLYSNEFMDVFMRQPGMDARYGGLARKALSYYLGDRYVPGDFPTDTELFIRQMIQIIVELKVFDKQPYDWPAIDNVFRKVLTIQGYPLPYDEAVLAKGYNGVMRGDLPKYYA